MCESRSSFKLLDFFFSFLIFVSCVLTYNVTCMQYLQEPQSGARSPGLESHNVVCGPAGVENGTRVLSKNKHL